MADDDVLVMDESDRFVFDDLEKYRPDQMRVPAGTEGGGQFAPEHGADLRPLIRDNGGFTYQPYDERAPRVGKMVSIYPERTKVYKIVPARDELDRFVAKNADLLKKPGHYFGAWEHRGRVYLDVAVVVRSTTRVRQLGERYHQLAAYDLATHTEIAITRKAADNGEAQTGDAHPWDPVEAELGRTLRPADKYRPDQERDDWGRWVDEGGVGDNAWMQPGDPRWGIPATPVPDHPRPDVPQQFESGLAAQEWADEHYADVKWSIDGMKPGCAAQLLLSYAMLREDYPEIAAEIKSVGTEWIDKDGNMRPWSDLLAEDPGLKDAGGMTHTLEGEPTYMVFNPRLWSPSDEVREWPENPVKAVTPSGKPSMYWSVDNGAPGYVLTHEFGHALTAAIFRMPGGAEELNRWYGSILKSKPPSVYATSSPAEAFSECFAERYHEPKSKWSKGAKELGPVLDLYKESLKP